MMKDRSKASIDRVVANALTDLVDTMPGLVLSIAKNYHFVTHVEEDTAGQVPVKINGVFHPVVAQKYSLIDLTKPMTYDYQEFIAHSNYLYNLFMDKDIVWYDC